MKILYLFILIFYTIQLKAQDIIIKKNGEIIKGEIIEKNNSIVKFKQHNSANNILYSIEMKDVQKISYANGYMEELDKNSIEKKEENKKEKFYKNSIGVEINKFFINALCLSYERFFKENMISVRIPFTLGRSFFGDNSNYSIYTFEQYAGVTTFYVQNRKPMFVWYYAPYFNGMIYSVGLNLNYYPNKKQKGYFTGLYANFGEFGYGIRPYNYSNNNFDILLNGKHYSAGVIHGFRINTNYRLSFSILTQTGLYKNETILSDEAVLFHFSLVFKSAFSF
jgi:hypothetical protein